MKPEVVEILKRESSFLKEDFKLRYLSVLDEPGQKNFNLESGITLLVEFRDDITFRQYSDLVLKLRKLLGIDVHIIIKPALKRIISKKIEGFSINVI